MATLREWLVRLLATFRARRSDADLDEELRAHLEFAAEEAERRGQRAPARAARLRLGGPSQVMEAIRDQRGLPWLADLIRDARYGCRMLAKHPGFTAVASLSLAIGIGANAAVFSYADALLLRPLAVPHPAEIVTVGSTTLSGRSRSSLVASYREYVDLRDRARSFDGLVAFTTATAAFAPGAGSLPKATIGMVVTANFFDVMGVEPQLGRTFRPDEDMVPARDAVVILGHDFWIQQFGSDRSVVGRTIRLNTLPFTVVGVAPAGFTGLDQYTRFQFYVPLMMWTALVPAPGVEPFEARDFRRLVVKGRLRDGVTIAQARSEVSAIAADLERTYPETNRNRPMAVRTELQARIQQAPGSATLIALLGLLAMSVLFVACANVASLLTSRAPTRAREMAFRLAMGAGRRRVIQQLMTENLLLAMIGGVLGVGVGYGGVLLFRQFQIPTELPIAVSFELDGRVFATSLLMALVSALLFGLAPAVRSARADLTAAMRATDAAAYGRRRWGRALLVGGQVALSVVLLAVATLVYRGFQERLGSGPGFRTERVLLMWFQPGLIGYGERQTQTFFEHVVGQARLVPGVTSASLTSYVPLDGGVARVALRPEGFQFPLRTESASVASAVVDEQYFDTLSIPILEGRRFLPTDSASTPKVAIVNEQLAHHYWPAQDPIGRRFRLVDDRDGWVEIVGVAKTSRYNDVTEPPTEFVYFPFRQRPQRLMALMTASAGDPAALVAPLRAVVRDFDAQLPIFNVRTLAENYRLRQLVIADVITRLIASMGIMGTALALVGLYGLVAYAASRRTREIGIRMALGARRIDVVRMMLAQGLTIAICGLALGLIASLAAAPALAAVVPGGIRSDGRIDVVAFLLVAPIVLAVTTLAAYVPARRASRIDPTDALRWE